VNPKEERQKQNKRSREEESAKNS